MEVSKKCPSCESSCMCDVHTCTHFGLIFLALERRKESEEAAGGTDANAAILHSLPAVNITQPRPWQKASLGSFLSSPGI